MAESKLKTDGGRRLVDVRPDRVDLRDREYRPPLISLPAQYPTADVIEALLPKYRDHEMILDQGTEGSCTGFGLAAVVNYLLWLQHNHRDKREFDAFEPIAHVSPRMLYHLARIYDEWDGEDYEGSSCRGAMKGWHRHGVCARSLWPYFDDDGEARFLPPGEGWAEDAAQRPLGAYYRINKDSIADMQAAIHEVGAIYCSGEVHAGWNLDPRDELPVIKARTKLTGGHAFALVGYNVDGFIVQNSWGTDWGYGGFAVLTYPDWAKTGMDAWVAVLGAPVRLSTHATTRRRVSLYTVAAERTDNRAGAANRVTVSGAPAPLEEHEALQHALVLANDGRPMNRLLDVENASAAVERVCFENPQAWLAAKSVKKIAIYAHGGLNDEEAAIERTQIMAPYFIANDIYPIFFAWRTGFLESVKSIIDDALGTSFGGPRSEGRFGDVLEKISDAKDRTVETMAQKLLGKAVWQQMKQNARAATQNTGGIARLADALKRLHAANPELEIHLVGHSAGSIVLGHLLSAMGDSGLTIRTTTLYAPACTSRFTVDHYGAAYATGLLPTKSMYIENMDDERERADSVGPYGKSLLYLVSRAFEDMHKTPLLGLDIATERRPKRDGSYWHADAVGDIKNANDFIKKAAVDIRLHGRDRQRVSDGVEEISLAHGSFDNDIEVVARTLRRIRGSKLKQDVIALHGF